ncbi:hypothetical protein PCANC_24128 [Puccinia coronata f. sp. avenae]|uniref:Protein kinase domain-containing protein n=1 Tax=Puccinia coronata f. sp. avenae TaxID=200324 RepID=A0A2N5TYR2_9BASI|nr:hypothetical protein PCANC_24128 [Puccinia coronata f. sp. avenae]
MHSSQSLLSLSPPSTPPLSKCSLPITSPSAVHPHPAAALLISRSSSLHSVSSHSTHRFLSSPSISRSSTLSDSTSSDSSSLSSSSAASSSAPSSFSHLAFPPTPPHSNHNTPLAERHRRSITPSKPASRNDIFALSLPQPSLPFSSTSQPHHPQPQELISSPSYDQLDLLRLKTSLHLSINTSPSSILGQGTHDTVHIALCSIPSIAQPAQLKPWKICAAKLSEDIPGSIKETLVLERLRSREQENQTNESANGSRFIVGWFGMKNEKECEWIRSPEENAKQRKRSSSQSFLPPIVLALEYCSGGDLFKFVQRANLARTEKNYTEDRRLEVGSRRWLRWSQELAEALKWCKERNVLIGDLKPQNVLLTADLRIKLSDFNRSTILSVEQSQGGLGLIDPQGTGTSVYAAPELVQPPPSPCSFPADIFALGITMYFLLTGREPYRGVQGAVERMLLISRGAFWEHELKMRWRMLEDGQSVVRPSLKNHKFPSRSYSNDSHHSQSSQAVVSQNTIDALYGFKPDLEADVNHRNSVLESEEEEYPAADSDTRIGFYSDGSPMLRYLNGNHIVPEQVLILISKMCSPAAADRPQIEQVIQQLQSITCT